jgi:thiol-disulfide isomerase/thioredoxin
MADRAPRKPNIVAIVLLGVVALALIAVVAGLVGGGDDDDDSTASTGSETRDVEVTGDALAQLEDPAHDPAVGQPAPVVTGQTFNGRPLTIPGDGPAVVVFLAHWCPHCQREVPFLVDHFEENGMPEGVDILAVTTSVDPSAPNYPPSEWLARERWDIPTLHDDEDDTAAKAFGLSAFPYFVAIDADGNVVARTSGELQAPQVEALIDAARGG